MTLSTATITFDVATILGADFDARRTKCWVTTNVPNDTLIDTDAGVIRLGNDTVTINADGTGSAVVWTPGPDGNPASWQTYFHFDYPRAGTRDRAKRTFGPYTITADANLAELEDEQAIPPDYQSLFVAAMEAIRDESEANLAAQVDISGIDTSDDVVSTLIKGTGGAGPKTRAELANASISRTSRGKHAPALGLYFPEAEGAANDGTTDDTAAIIAAEAAARAAGGTLYGVGSYKVTGTVTIACDADLSRATFLYAGTDTVAVRVGTTATTGSVVWDLNVRLPDLMASAKTVTGWAQVAGLCGVELCNLYDSTVHVGHIKNFETNLRCYGRGRGFVYNTVFLGQLDNGKVNLLLGADATGWCNENSFFVGHLSHQSGEGTSVAGTREIEIEVCTNPVNNNKFYGPSVEGNVAEFQLLIAGVSNRVISGRYEVTGGARVRWASDAARNLVDGGHNAVSIVESFAAGAAYTNELRANGRRLTNGYTWREGGSAAEGLDIIMDPGARVAGSDRTTAYRVFRCGNYTAMKRAADTNDRLRFDHDNGRVYFGTGAAALSRYLELGNGGIAANSGSKLLAPGGLGVGNSAAATTPGTVVKKMQVFDASGASLGYVAIYDAIS